MRKCIAGLAVIAACSGSAQDRCNEDKDCPSGMLCNVHVCIEPSGCVPPCASFAVCQTATRTCKDVAVPDVAITSPGSGAYIGATISVSATAHAPGGVNAVRFELRASDGTTVLETATASTATGDPSNFAAQLAIANQPDGAALLFAIVEYSGGTLVSSGLPVTIDLAPPDFPPPPASYAGKNPLTTVVAIIDDQGSGVASAQLTLQGKSYPGVIATDGRVTFAVPTSDFDVPDGETATSTYSIAAVDRVGNSASTNGQILVDHTLPSVTLDADTVWHAGTETAQVTGSASDTGSGISTIIVAAGGTSTTAVMTQGHWTAALSLTQAQLPAGFEGPLTLTVTATDLAGNLQTATGALLVDAAGPSISAITFPGGNAAGGAQVWFAAGAGSLTVTAAVTDQGSGVASASLQMTGLAPIAGAPVAGAWAFAVPRAPGNGLDGTKPLIFTLQAIDKLGNATTSAAQSLWFDDVPPAVTVAAIGKANAPPGYPAAVPGTGYDGSHYIDSDFVTVSGVISDAAALMPEATVEVDGAGGPQLATISCGDGAKACPYSATFQLSAAPLHAGSGEIQVTVRAADKALDANGAPAGHSGQSAPVSIAVTRFAWSQDLGAGVISGLALDGSGRVIATTNNATGDSVFALNHDGSLAWRKGTGFYGTGGDLGAIDGAPSIGAGGNIYLATASGDLVSLDASGNALVSCGRSAAGFHFTPAVGQLPGLGCEGLLAGGDDAQLHAACLQGTSCNEIAATLSHAATSPVVIANQQYDLGSSTVVNQTSIDPAHGNFRSTAASTKAASAFTSLASDGTVFYAVSGTAISAWSSPFSQLFSLDTGSAIGGGPALDSSGALFETGEGDLRSVSRAGNGSVLAALPAAGDGLLLGADARLYATAGAAVLAIDEAGNALDWSLANPDGAAATGAPTLACDGTLYVPAGNRVYAFVTGAHGLAATPWPKYQRDTRNSGNADAATLWGASVGGVCIQ